ncbi:MAG: M1 family aminopeptidase [Halioglobus sp.]
MSSQLITAAKTLLAGLSIGLTAACDQSGLAVESGVSLPLAQYRAGIISNLSYRVTFDIPAQAADDISGHIIISMQLSGIEQPLQLDFRASADNIKRVTINQRTSEYLFSSEHLVIPQSELQIGMNKIEIEFIAGSQSLNRNPEYLYTLFVPDRARTAFPVFDQPDLKATYELTLIVPGDWVALSNAPIESIDSVGTRRKYQFKRSDLISSYLFSFVAGKFQAVTRTRDGHSMTMLHRETDPQKLQRNLDDIFDLHWAALDWLENYTGIEYPYQKFDFALIPAFQYRGMEHVGAVQYRAATLLLDESASEMERLSRAKLIAHETAHMWFGDLVTMRWFDDVWTKEVFANFMAAKIINPSFPEIDHELNFLATMHPGAYAVDRTAGANPIRQYLGNLNGAGQMYGAIIYKKAPIMMRQLETLIGEGKFRQGVQTYLQRYSFANASWPDLIAILDALSDEDLQAWSDVWVNTPGRPAFLLKAASAGEAPTQFALLQQDFAGSGRVWPQQFEIMAVSQDKVVRTKVLSTSASTALVENHASTSILFNSDGFGYALFPASIKNLELWDQLSDLERGSELINLYEQLLTSASPDVEQYLMALQRIIVMEKNQLLLDLALKQLHRIYWSFLTPAKRLALAPELETTLWQTMLSDDNSSRKKLIFLAFADIALSPGQVQKVYDIWAESLQIDQLILSENDNINLSQTLAIKLPESSSTIVSAQIKRTENPDSQRRMHFISASLAADQSERDTFFSSLAQEKNREVESWVLDALKNLHHPLRRSTSERYILPSLALLQEIQVTGDIFFPALWLNATLVNYNSSSAVNTVTAFLAARPGYDEQLRMKILQSADMAIRANSIVARALPE